MIWMWYMLGCSVALVIEGDWQGKKVEGPWSWHYHENYSCEVEGTIISFLNCPRTVTDCEILTVSL